MLALKRFSSTTVFVSIGGCLFVLAVVSLTLLGGIVHTKDIIDDKAKSSADDILSFGKEHSVKVGVEPTAASELELKSKASEWRSRSGRLYNGNGAIAHNQTPESYAAAYAAVQSAEQTHMQQQADATAYNSFGESNLQVSASSIPQSGPTSPVSMARQLSTLGAASSSATTTSAEYPANYPSSSSYYANLISPSSTSETAYGAPMQSANHHHHAAYPSSQYERHSPQQSHHISPHHSYYKSSSSPALGYPHSLGANSYHYDRFGSGLGHASFWPMSPLVASPSSVFPTASGSLVSSASHALSHWTNGFTIGEIICGLIAISIGAVILGAPFFLIYLALMGNFSGSGTLSLTNPTAASGAAAAASGGTTPAANGRRKRLAIFESSLGDDDRKVAGKHFDVNKLAHSVAKELSPLIDVHQVADSFKLLIRSIEKYSSHAN